MAQTADDPWDWGVDRVVQELCTDERSWQLRSKTMSRPDPMALERALREQEITGSVLLVDVDDVFLKEDLGLRILGRRAFVRSAISALQVLSAKYQDYMLVHQPESMIATQVSRSIHDYMQQQGFRQQAPRTPTPAHPPQSLLLPGQSAIGITHDQQLTGLHSSLAPPVEGEGRPVTSEESASKRRKLSEAFSGNDEDALFHNPAPSLGADEVNSTLLSEPGSTAAAQANDKKRKRIAPTLISTGIDTDGNGEISNDAEDVWTERPGDTDLCRQEYTSPATIKSPLHNAEPGTQFVDKEGRKRIVPFTVSSGDHGNQDAAAAPGAQDTAAAITPNKQSMNDPRKATNKLITKVQPYLGRPKMSVDGIFYKGVKLGEEILDTVESKEFSQIASHCPSGQRIYVHNMMKHFFRTEHQVIRRGSNLFSAIRPYSEKLAPRFQKPSFTLYYSSPDEQIRARRESLSSWPEIDPEVTQTTETTLNDRSVTFNPVGPDMLSNLSDTWDPESLQKYKNIEGGDKVLPLYGESDDENEYDMQTWKEIEEERGELNRPERRVKKPTLSREEVEDAVDEAITEFVSKWSLKILPKRRLKAYKIWRKSRKENSKREQIVGAQKDLDHIHRRIAKLREEICRDLWTTKLHVRRQAQIIEPSISSQEDLQWKISVLELKKCPDRPPQVPSMVGSKKSAARPNDGEDGESLDTESEADSSDDGLDDFVIGDPDDALPTTEQELHELNLADSEDEMLDGEELDDIDDIPIPDASPSVRSEKRSARRIIKIRTKKQRSASPTSDEFFSPMSAHNASTLVKNEPPAVQKPLNPQAPPDMIDLTMTSSDTSPPKKFYSLTTTEKPDGHRQTRKIRILNRDSLLQKVHETYIISSGTDEEKQPSAKDPPIPLSNPRAIAKTSTEFWVKTYNKDSLLIKAFYLLDGSLQKEIFEFMSEVGKFALWENMNKVLVAIKAKEESIKGMDAPTFKILHRLAWLFSIYADCRWHIWSEDSKELDTQRIHTNKEKFFTPFYVLCSRLEEYFSKTPVNSVSPSQPKEPVSVAGDDSSDEEPISTSKRRRSKDTSDSEDDLTEKETPRKRKRKIFEDANARQQRERDRERLQEQAERRNKLQAILAKSGHADDEDRGKIIINDAAAEDEGFVYINPYIARRIKKHQVEGVRFLWNQIVTTDETNMQGCLLAHTMGLGKTAQSITLLVAIADAAASIDPRINSQIPPSLKVSKTLVLCPPTLIDNWMDELLIWTPCDNRGDFVLGDFRKVDSSKKLLTRLEIIKDWYHDGGVLIIGYDMFRDLVVNKEKKQRGRALTDEQHEEVLQHLLEGPNIIIADEAHKMKNADAGVTKAAGQFRSMSRIALTGSPLANNILEYHTMIEWVAPNYLGPLAEFKSKYEEPIKAGLYTDSQPHEKRKSMKMLGVLKEDLAPKVHRANMSVLRHDLPKKREFVITVPLTELQREAYTTYVNSMMEGNAYSQTKSGEVTQATLWHWLAVLSLLCNHPQCFNAKLNERREEARKEIASGISTPLPVEDPDDAPVDMNAPVWKVGVSKSLVDAETEIFSKEPDMLSVELSFKVKILCQILDAAKEAEDKCLIFSQSLPTLDFLQALFDRQGRKFGRLDGKTKMGTRQNLVKQFNTGSTDIYLISTTAGGLGLNFYGANRVVIFDFKFNPIMEEQAVGRAYRIGQRKETFVYRFVAGGTFESSVHNRTVFKTQLASRVVDKKNPLAYAHKKLGDFLFEPKEVPQENLSEYRGMDPKVLDKILDTQDREPTIRAIVEMDSFEIVDKDDLTAEELVEVQKMADEEKLKRTNPRKWEEQQRIKAQEQAQQQAQQYLQSRQAIPVRMTNVPPPNRGPSNPIRLQQTASRITLSAPGGYRRTPPARDQLNQNPPNASLQQAHQQINPLKPTDAQANERNDDAGERELVSPSPENDIEPQPHQLPNGTPNASIAGSSRPKLTPLQGNQQRPSRVTPQSQFSRPILGANTKAQSLTPESDTRSPTDNIRVAKRSTNASGSNPNVRIPSGGSSGEISDEGRSGKSLLTIQSVIVHSANGSDELSSLGSRVLSNRANRITREIETEIQKNPEFGKLTFARGSLWNALARSPNPGRELLSSSITAKEFVRRTLTGTPAEPTSSNSNAEEEIGKVCISQNSSNSQTLPSSQILQPSNEVEKPQIAAVLGQPDLSDAAVLQAGIHLQSGEGKSMQIDELVQQNNTLVGNEMHDAQDPGSSTSRDANADLMSGQEPSTTSEVARVDTENYSNELMLAEAVMEGLDEQRCTTNESFRTAAKEFDMGTEKTENILVQPNRQSDNITQTNLQALDTAPQEGGTASTFNLSQSSPSEDAQCEVQDLQTGIEGRMTTETDLMEQSITSDVADTTSNVVSNSNAASPLPVDKRPLLQHITDAFRISPTNG